MSNDSINIDPYLSPKAELLDASNTKEWVPDYLKDFNTHVLFHRIFASLIDCGLFFILIMIFILLFGKDISIKYMPLFIFMGPFFYFSILEGLWGCTIGKFICQIRVVNKYGEVPGVPRAIVRTILRGFEANPFIFFSLPAGIVSFCSKRGQRLGDMVAKTYVLKCKSLIEANRIQPIIDVQETS